MKPKLFLTRELPEKAMDKLKTYFDLNYNQEDRVLEKEEIIAKFDRTQLIRVVTNLVKNAVQAVDKEKNPAVLVTVTEEEGRACLVVSDNGVGISEENKDKVFEPKFTTKSSGMGLGLAMVKNIVESCGGSIEFTSKLNKGTIFKVHFPK